MKKRELVKRVKKIGASLVREGLGHEVWESVNGYIFTIPRHSEIKENTAKAIIKQAKK